MSKNLGIWLDHEKAHLVMVEGDQVSTETLVSNFESRLRIEGEGKNYSSSSGLMVHLVKKRTERRRHQLRNYYSSIMSRLTGVKKIYIFGPAGVGKELGKEISRHKHHSAIPVYIEKADNMTLNQIIARVKKYFSSEGA